MLYEVLIIIGSYLLGSICFGYIIGRIKGIDIRNHGTKNAGTSNVFLTLGVSAGVFCAVMDIVKGAIPVLIASKFFSPLIVILSGLAAIIGHIFPIYLKFKGGKGLATTIGVFVVLAPFEFLIALGLWVVSMFITKRFFLPMLVALLLVPFLMFYYDRNIIFIIGFVAIALIVLLKMIVSHTTFEDMISGKDYRKFIGKFK